MTIVALSYLVIEALHAEKFLSEGGVSAEIIDMRSVSPIDWRLIEESVIKTGNLIVADTGVETCSVASEVIAHITMTCFAYLKAPPIRIAMPNVPEPTSYGLTSKFHADASDICAASYKILGRNSVQDTKKIKSREPHDVPGDWFTGPF